MNQGNGKVWASKEKWTDSSRLMDLNEQGQEEKKEDLHDHEKIRKTREEMASGLFRTNYRSSMPPVILMYESFKVINI